MVLRLTTLFTFLILVIKVDAQAWQIAFGGDERDQAEGLYETRDKGFLFCGRTWSNTSDPGVLDNAFAAKTDKFGNLLWTYQFNSPFESKAFDINETQEKDVILIGDEGSDPDGYSMFIIRLDKDGNHISTKIIDDFYGSGRRIIKTSDGGYAIGGAISQRNCDSSIPALSFDFLVAKFDQDFNMEWSNCTGEISSDRLGDIIETSDKDLVIVGNGRVEITEEDDIWVVRFNGQSGDIEWLTTFGGFEFDIGKSVIEINNEDLLAAGSWSQGDSTFVFRLNSSGDIKQRNFYTTPIQTTEREGILVDMLDGNIALISGKGGDIIYTTLDFDGEIVDRISIGNIGIDSENPSEAILTSGGGLAICGYIVNSANGSSSDALLMRTDSNFVSSTNDILNNNNIHIYPNPFRDFTTLKITDEKLLPAKSRIEIYSSQGKLVYKSQLPTNELRINGDQLLPGFYFYHIVSESGRIHQGKLMKY